MINIFNELYNKILSVGAKWITYPSMIVIRKDRLKFLQKLFKYPLIETRINFNKIYKWKSFSVYKYFY